jgi:hypothetical protein
VGVAHLYVIWDREGLRGQAYSNIRLYPGSLVSSQSFP